MRSTRSFVIFTSVVLFLACAGNGSAPADGGNCMGIGDAGSNSFGTCCDARGNEVAPTSKVVADSGHVCCPSATTPTAHPCLKAGQCLASQPGCAASEYCDVLSCFGQFDVGQCTPRPTSCSTGDAGAPVCGCDKVTYDGTCQANAAGTSVLHDGPC